MLIAGDFNVPSVNWNNDFPEPLSSASEPFVDIVVLHNLSQLVKEPTRIQNNTQSILDLFLANTAAVRCNPQIQVFEGISDHKMVYLTLEVNLAPQTENHERIVPDFSRASDIDVLDALHGAFSEFHAMCESNEHCIDDIWGYFKFLVLKCIRDFVPVKRKVLRTRNPWVTKEIVRIERKLKKARKQLKQRPTVPASDRLLGLRTLLADKIKKSRILPKNNTKKFPSLIPRKVLAALITKKESCTQILYW